MTQRTWSMLKDKPNGILKYWMGYARRKPENSGTAEDWPMTRALHFGLLSALATLLLVGGCATPKTADVPLLAGMSRNQLRLYFGEPVRIVPGPSGGEDWYYRFTAWKTRPTGVTGTSEEFGEKTSYFGVGLAFSKDAVERPVHLSAEGVVLAPLPAGKIITE